MKTIDKESALDIAHGACLLGSGGGGTLAETEISVPGLSGWK